MDAAEQMRARGWFGPEIEDEFSNYLRSLGYTVTWDNKGDNRWYEVSDEGRMLFQIDFGVPLSDFLMDLPLLADGHKGISKSDYTICVVAEDGDKDLKALLYRTRYRARKKV